MSTGTPTRLFWEQHACLPLTLEANVEDILRYHRPGGAYVSINVGYAPHTKEMSLGFLDTFRRDVAAHRELELAGSVAEIDAAHAAGRIVVAFDLEDSRPVADDLDMVKTYYDLGVRSLLPAYNNANSAGCGCLDKEDTGLTAYGRSLISTMLEVGMMADGSHCSIRTGLDIGSIAGEAGKPMIYSHSAMRGLHDHPRNVTDEQARLCAETGGVIGIPGIGIFLGENTATMEAYVDHIDYAVQLVGPEHVGIGSDYSFDAEDVQADLEANPDLFPEEYTRWGVIRFIDPETTLTVEQALLDRGYSDEDVRGILGGNFRRVAREVWV